MLRLGKRSQSLRMPLSRIFQSVNTVILSRMTEIRTMRSITSFGFRASTVIFVPADDVELESIVLKQEAERVEREALIDFALSTYNEKLFRQVMNGELESVEEEEETKEAMSQADFIKQVNLRAWI